MALKFIEVWFREKTDVPPPNTNVKLNIKYLDTTSFLFTEYTKDILSLRIETADGEYYVNPVASNTIIYTQVNNKRFNRVTFLYPNGNIKQVVKVLDNCEVVLVGGVDASSTYLIVRDEGKTLTRIDGLSGVRMSFREDV